MWEARFELARLAAPASEAGKSTYSIIPTIHGLSPKRGAAPGRRSLKPCGFARRNVKILHFDL